MQATGIVNLAGVALLLTIGAPAGSSQATSRAPQAELVGAWTLNAELTERPGPGMEENTSPRRAPPVQPPGSSGGRGPNSPVGYGGGRPNADETARMREAIRLATLIPERLTIVRDERGFAVTDAGGVTHRLTPDGKTVKSRAGALTVETKARWEDAVLVVDRKFEGGVKSTDRYSVTAAPRRLVIASKVEGDRRAGARTFQRVYDAVQ